MASRESRIDIIFDIDDSSPSYRPTIEAVTHAIDAAGVDIDVAVVRTGTIDSAYLASLPAGVVIGPGSPYTHPGAAELVITTARERGLPLVGT